MITLKKLNNKNVKRVAEIEHECFTSERWSESLIRNEINDTNKYYVVAYAGTKVVGFGGYAQIIDEGHIINIAVTENFRRQGVATLILHDMIDNGKKNGLTSFTLETRISNTAARLLYEREGFVLSGIRPKFYPDKEDACIYWLYM